MTRKTYCGNLLWQSSLTLLVPETDAETLLEWVKEYNLPAHGPERHMNRKFKDEHIHIGPVDHIKIDK